MVKHFRGFFVVGVWFRADLGQLSGLLGSLSITHKNLVMRSPLPGLVALLSLATANSSNVVAAVILGPQIGTLKLARHSCGEAWRR